MRLTQLSLPVLHNWDCHACGECCREYEIHITDEERLRIVAQKWESDPIMNGETLFRKVKRFGKQYRLNHRESDDGCVFLDEKGLCRIHTKFGEAAKPLACRVYPFILIPVGKQWKIGLRFACPSVTKNVGRALDAHLPALKEYAQALEKRANVTDETVIAPPASRQRRRSIGPTCRYSPDTFERSLPVIRTGRWSSACASSSPWSASAGRPISRRCAARSWKNSSTC